MFTELDHAKAPTMAGRVAASSVEISSSMRRVDNPKERERERLSRLRDETGFACSSLTASSLRHSTLTTSTSRDALSSSSRSSSTSTDTTVHFEPREYSAKDRSAILTARQRQIDDAMRKIRSSQEVDLCFVVDCTGSMSSYITATKQSIVTISRTLREHNKGIQVHAAFVGYRDYCDGSDRLVSLDFTADHAKFESFVGSQAAKGGGDAPEDVLHGLETAMNLSWKRATRIIFHIGDYPPHGAEYSSFHSDPCSPPYPKGFESALLSRMAQQGIMYFFGRIFSHTDKMIACFERTLGPIIQYDFSSSDISAIIKQLVQSTVTSILSSVSISASTSIKDYMKHKKEYTIKKSIPDWDLLNTKTGTVSSYKMPTSVEQIKAPFSNTDKAKNLFKRAPQPFSFGKERFAFYGLDVTYDKPQEVVFKEFQTVGKKENSLEHYLEFIEAQTIASYLATEFNKTNPGKSIMFLKARVHYYPKQKEGKDGKPFIKKRYAIMEPLIKGASFKRFNSNAGIIEEFHSTLEAFSHFTYHTTGGYLVITDLQGAQVDDKFILTDPAIHCVDTLRFGRTNLGDRGLNECFKRNHVCNSVCSALRLPPF